MQATPAYVKRRGKTTMTIKRNGKFVTQMFGPHHCGTKDIMEIKYDFLCSCDITSLDDRGFMFDQTRVDLYFQTQVKRTSLSCELLAIDCARGLFRRIISENPKCKMSAMALTLSPEPFAASITVDWKDAQ